MIVDPTPPAPPYKGGGLLSLRSVALDDATGHARRRVWRMVRLFAVVVVLVVVGWIWQKYGQALPIAMPVIRLEEAGPAERQAIQDAQAVVRKKPRSAAAWGRLGIVLLAHNFEDAAGECFSAAQHLDPTSFRWPYYAGVCAAISDPQRALGDFARSAQLAPEDPWPRFRQAELLMDLQRLDEAERVLKTIDSPDQAHRLLYDHVRLALLRQDKDALQQLTAEQLQQLASGANRRACLELLAQVWHRLGRPTAAAAVAKQLRDQTSGNEGWDDPYVAEVFAVRTDPLWQADLARQAFDAGDAEGAVQRMQELIENHPADPQWPLELARLWSKLRKTENALSVLQAAAKKNPQSAAVRFELGNLQYQSQDWSAAVNSYAAATRLKPDYGLAHYNLGQAQLKLQHETEAISAFRDALRCQPDLAVAHVNLGDLLSRSGKPSDLE